MGDIMEEESLFSLELFAEKLRVSGVPCRFPALAFRLLDYPTLIIYHVEPDLATTIRSEITADLYYNLGPHIPELQDKHGDYVVKKGKSCLFKTSARHLYENLSTTPLYVMLIDTYPEVPKLLGSFGIPLDSCMIDISKDIDKNGINTPSTHGEKGDYKIYNLMGALVGHVSMGFRLLSLGQGLLAHIPESAVLKSKAVSRLKEEVDGEKASNLIDENVELLTKNVQVSIPSARPNTEDQITQTAHNSSIKTVEKNQSKSKKSCRPATKPKNEIKELDDIIVNNVDCPPPLFYNSHAAEPDLEHYSYGLTLSDNIVAENNETRKSSKAKDQGSTESDEDTIRQEDKFDDSDAEELVDFKVSKIYKTDNHSYPPRAPQSFHRTIVRGGGGSIVPNAFPNLSFSKNLPGLPLLNALLQEILALQDLQSQPAQDTQKTPVVEMHSVPKETVAPEKIHKDKQLQSQDLKITTPEPTTPGRHTHRTCASHEPPVPKNKSWLRSQPTLGIKKSKLTYGLTNTQRLRLAKANPELLKTLEEAEALRVASRKQKGKEDKIGILQDGADGMNTLQDRTNVKYQPMGKTVPAPEAVVPSQQRIILGSPRPPKPTPRLSKQYTRDRLLSDVSLQPSFTRQSSLSRPESALSHNQSTDVETPFEIRKGALDTEEHSSESDSRKDMPALGKTMTIAVDRLKDLVGSKIYHDLGAPADTNAISAEDIGFKNMVETYSDGSDQQSELKGDDINYSTDDDHFSDSGLQPQLRKILDTYSEDDSEVKSPVSTGHEPSLRKVVDHYSDTEDAESPIAKDYEPKVREVEDKYSESESSSHSNSFASTRKHRVPGNEQYVTGPTELNTTTSLGQPLTSENSPIPANKTIDFGTTRTVVDLSNNYDTRDSPNSTAFLSRSQVHSENGTSMESAGDWPKRPPKPSPRRKMDKMSSVHTDSVSSYAPSEPENVSPDIGLEDDVYSDDFDENDSLRNQNPKDLKVASNAKLGYTWS